MPVLTLIAPALLQFGAVTLVGATLTVPPLTLMFAPALLANVVGLIVNVPAVALSVALLVNVPGDRVKVCPAVLAMMLPLLVTVATLL